jgi:hypothetical protein
MSFQTTYTIEAFPKGERTTVATLHGTHQSRDHDLAYAAMRANVSVGSELDGIVAHAQTQAKVRGEYVDVYRIHNRRTGRDGKVIGGTAEHIATVGPEGVI